MKLLIKKLYPDTIVPTYGSKGAAGLDLSAYGVHLVHARTRKLIPTGLSIQWVNNGESTDVNNGEPTYEKVEDYYLRIAPRSGLSVKHLIDIGAGVVDSDYRGEVKVCFINNSDSDYQISHGDRIAQGILERIVRFDTIEVVDELVETTRGDGGFGSTGK